MKKTCLVCTASFDAKRASALFCSARCRKQNHRNEQEDELAHWKIEARRWKEKAQRPFADHLNDELVRLLEVAYLRRPWMTREAKAQLWKHLHENTTWGINLLLDTVGNWADVFSAQPQQPPAPQTNKVQRAFKLFSLPPTATLDQAKAAYRDASRRHHPDLNGGKEGRMKEVNEAYEVLKKHFAQQPTGVRV